MARAPAPAVRKCGHHAGSNWNFRWPECRTADCRKACRWAVRAPAPRARNRRRVLPSKSWISRCRRPVPSRPAASPVSSCRKDRCGWKAFGANLPAVSSSGLRGLVDGQRAHWKMEREQKAARQTAGQQPDGVKRLRNSSRQRSSRELLRLTLRSRLLDGGADAYVSAATADIPRHRRVDVTKSSGLGWPRARPPPP